MVIVISSISTSFFRALLRLRLPPHPPHRLHYHLLRLHSEIPVWLERGRLLRLLYLRLLLLPAATRSAGSLKDLM